MSVSKQQKERDKAVRHLFEFIEKSETWGPRISDLMAIYMRPVVAYFDEDERSVQLRMEQSPFGPMIYGFIMEMMAVTSWDGESATPIEAYLKQRGWREGRHGRRYLRALLESDMHFLEVTAVEPGRWAEVRPYGSNGPSERIIERGGSENMHPYDALVARLVPLGKAHRFGSVLPLTHHGAQHLKDSLDNVESDLKELYEEAVAEDGPEGLVENFVDGVDEERRLRTEETGFMNFAIDALRGPTQTPPQMFNTDNERMVITKTRLPIVGDVQEIRTALDDQDELFADNDAHWSWLKSDGSNTLLGSIKIQDKYLEFESNSVERSERGVAMLQTCLDEDLVGAPMSVHENFQDTLSAPQAPSRSSNSIDIAQHPELQSMVQDMLKKQYLTALDEPIPMLDNESPRVCAADPDKRHKAIDWVKYLENQESKSPASSHDFTWMWKELRLVEYR